MDLSKRRPSPNRSLAFSDHNPPDSQKRMVSQKEGFDESDENSQPSLREFTARWEEPPSTKHFMSDTVSSASKKKILSERNQEASSLDTHFTAALPQNTPRVRSADCTLVVSSASPTHASYDPVTNYLSPRPQFLRYDPNRRQEFLQRMEAAGSVDIESPTSSSSQEEVIQEVAEDGSDLEDDGVEDEAEEKRSPCSIAVCKLLLLLGALLFSTCCISSMNYPAAHYLEESGGFLENHLMMGNHSMFYRNPLESLVNSTEICLIVHPRDLVSLDEGIEYKSLVLDDLIKREDLEGKESDSVDSTTGDLMFSDKLAERVDVEEDRFDDDIGLVTGNEENVLEEKESYEISDSTLGDSTAGNLLIPDKLAEWVDTEDNQFNDGIGLLSGNQEDLLGGEELQGEKSDTILGDSTTVDLLNPDKPAESIHVEEDDGLNGGTGWVTGNEKILLVNRSLSGNLPRDEEDGLNGRTGWVTGNEKILLVNRSLSGNLPRDEEDGEEAVECHEFLVEEQYGRAKTSTAADDIVTESTSKVPQSNIVSDKPSIAEIDETTESSTVSDFEVKWELSHIWICSLTAVLGLLTALYMYFTRPRRSELLESPSCSDPAVEGKASSAVLMNGDTESKGHNEGFSSVEATVLEKSYQDLERRVAEILRTPVPSGHPSDEREEYGTCLPTAEVLRTPELSRHSSGEHEELYESHPPSVELLGEFSFIDMKTSQTGSGRQSERSRSKGSPLHQYESKGSKRKSPSSSANKVLPSSPVESLSNGSFSAWNKSLRKEDTSDDRQKTVAITPLRRSGRLRSRVTSP